MPAGVSADYYLRLEQGRDRHPSLQLLEVLEHPAFVNSSWMTARSRANSGGRCNLGFFWVELQSLHGQRSVPTLIGAPRHPCAGRR